MRWKPRTAALALALLSIAIAASTTAGELPGCRQGSIGAVGLAGLVVGQLLSSAWRRRPDPAAPCTVGCLLSADLESAFDLGTLAAAASD